MYVFMRIGLYAHIIAVPFFFVFSELIRQTASVTAERMLSVGLVTRVARVSST